jgi:BRO family, N-terminal domain/ORF6C domain
MTTDDTALSVIEEQADASIRRIWHDGRWFFSVIDLIGVLTDSARPRKYWSDLKKRLLDEEGFSELSAKIGQLKMPSADGKYYRTDAADRETVLRLIQSIPSPKAEPVKQWLARVGVERLEEQSAQAMPAIGAEQEIADLRRQRPEEAASAMAWADYHAAMATLYRRQAAYEAQLLYVDAKLVEHDEQIGELHSRMESLEEGQRLLPELLARLGPQTLTSEHQATVKAMAGRLHEMAGFSFAAIYGDLNAAFHVGKYSDIPDAQWAEISAWLQQRIDAAQRGRKS